MMEDEEDFINVFSVSEDEVFNIYIQIYIYKFILYILLYIFFFCLIFLFFGDYLYDIDFKFVNY